MYRLLYLFLLLLIISMLPHCQGGKETGYEGPVSVDPAALPYPLLSQYGFFRGQLREMAPNERVLPYELITPLFTDYAHKARFVWMPEGVQASVDSAGVIRFPEQTVLIKNFYYPADFRKPEEKQQMVETRLLVQRAGKWEAFTYVWNEDQTDAELSVVGDFRPVSWTDEQGRAREIEYVVPNKNQCKSCHNANNVLEPVGPKVRNLHRTLTYAGGRERSQLQAWQEAGILAAGDYESKFAPIADWSDARGASLQDRALAYLDVNCGHCHRPEGPAHTSGLYLSVDYATQPGRLGVCKTPVAAGKGSGGHSFGIRPGQPDSSILVFRMESTDPGIMMPELGRVVPHTEGIQLVRDWIASLSGDCR